MVDLLNHLVNLSCSSPDLDQTETATAVPIGMTATVSCTATFPNEVNMTDANTYWQDDDEIPLTKSYKGVVNISVSEPSDYSISSVLQVQASVISGAKWPKQLTYVADVVLPDGGEFTLKSKPYFINIVGELLLTFYHTDAFVCSSYYNVHECKSTYICVHVLTHLQTCICGTICMQG